jgi:Divergent InlB B-repeat domain
MKIFLSVIVVICMMVVTAQAASYQTTFPLTENPISESSMWLNGAIDGIDWSNVYTSGGNALGTQKLISDYNDSTALVKGSWGADQYVKVTVYNNGTPAANNPEVEIRLRSSISSHSCTGYEVQFSVTGNYQYRIVKWNGPLDSYSELYIGGTQALSDGDVIEASMIGSTIMVWLNGVQVMTTTDSTYTSGNPGIGFWTQSSSGADNARYGFKDFLAYDSDTTPPPTPSTYNLTTNVTGQGSIASNPSGGTYNSGTSVTITANPASGWKFDHWEGDASGTNPTATIIMGSDRSVTAVFTQIPVTTTYILSTSMTGSGYITLNPSGRIYNSGTSVTATATPSAGWKFDHWEGAASGTSSKVTIIMNSNKTIKGVFTQTHWWRW